MQAIRYQQQTPDIQVLFAQFLSQLQPWQIEHLKTSKPDGYPDIRIESRSHVNTAIAARWLGRREQTLRGWACLENGPVRPVRVAGKLAWPVDEIRSLLGVA